MPAPITGQIALSGTAQPLSANPVTVQAFTIKAPATNTHTAFIGPAAVTSSNGYPIDPGGEFEYERLLQAGQPGYQLNPSDIYVVGTGPDVLAWFGSPGQV